MASLRLLTRARPALWLALIALALSVRALVPAGWMPALGSGGTVVLAPCTGMTPAAPVASAHAAHHASSLDREPAPGHPDRNASPCAFAGVAAAVDAIPAAVAAAVAVAASPAAPIRPPVAIGLGLAAPPPPSTGPPALI